MKKPARPPSVSEEKIRTLLKRYACPVPFHQVRTRFLGRIASPAIGVSPMDDVKGLWGGNLPEFESLDAANEVIGALVMGLWNQLTRHQERGAPFRLLRMTTPATRQGLATLALTRQQELDGFVEGLFGQDDVVDLPERAQRAVSSLAEMRALFAATAEVADDETRPGTAEDMAETLRHLHEMTRIVEHEMHEAVLSCTRARRQMLAGLPTKKPTLH